MLPSINSFPTIFFISSILVLISINNIGANPSSSNSLIQKACSNDSIKIDTQLCLLVLQSDPNVISAKDLYSLSIVIIESGISNSIKTCRHLETMLVNQRNARPRVKGALQDCKSSYDGVIDGFNSALHQLKDYDYFSSLKSLWSARDDVKQCGSALSSQKIGDVIILTGNRVVPIFVDSASSIVGDLLIRSAPPSQKLRY